MRSDSSCFKSSSCWTRGVVTVQINVQRCNLLHRYEKLKFLLDHRTDLYGTANTKEKKSVKTVKTALYQDLKLGSSA